VERWLPSGYRGAAVPLTYVPPFPTDPPETSWMREPTTSMPGLILRIELAHNDSEAVKKSDDFW
jgi:hypothetical protein